MLPFSSKSAASPSSFWQRLANQTIASSPPVRWFRQLLWPILVLGVVLLAALALFLAGPALHLPRSVVPAAGAGLIAIGIGALAVLWWRLRRQVLRPWTELRDWTARLHRGSYSVRLPADHLHGELATLATDLNDLGDELRSLNLQMAARVRLHTRHLARKTRSLEILYDIASTLSKTHTLDELLDNFLDTFAQLFDARAAMVRLVTDSGQLRLVASRGLDPAVIEREKLMPMDRCLCGHTASGGQVQIQ